MASARYEALNKRNLFAELMQLRDAERERQKTALQVVQGKELPQEVNPQGMMRWYMHPSIDDTILKCMIMYVQEIPPGSRSGCQKYQGGMVVYVWRGKGYTVLDGVKHPWEAGDVMQLPLRPKGVVFQHFNAGEETVKLIACEANMVGALGLDRGSGFDQLEFCPEFEKIQAAAPRSKSGVK